MDLRKRNYFVYNPTLWGNNLRCSTLVNAQRKWERKIVSLAVKMTHSREHVEGGIKRGRGKSGFNV